MRRLLTMVGIAALGVSASAHAGPSTTCQVFEHAYRLEMADLDQLEREAPPPPMPDGSDYEFFSAAFTPLDAFMQAERLGYDQRLAPQERTVASLIQCAREHQCAWISRPGVGMSPAGRKLPAAACFQ